MVNGTKTYLPPLEEYSRFLEIIWESHKLTNHGPLVAKLELMLSEFLGVIHLFFVANGTIAIQIAIKALDLKGEILTTPFSYVAISSSTVWEGCQPIEDISGRVMCLPLSANFSREDVELIYAVTLDKYPSGLSNASDKSNRIHTPNLRRLAVLLWYPASPSCKWWMDPGAPDSWYPLSGRNGLLPTFHLPGLVQYTRRI